MERHGVSTVSRWQLTGARAQQRQAGPGQCSLSSNRFGPSPAVPVAVGAKHNRTVTWQESAVRPAASRWRGACGLRISESCEKLQCLCSSPHSTSLHFTSLHFTSHASLFTLHSSLFTFFSRFLPGLANFGFLYRLPASNALYILWPIAIPLSPVESSPSYHESTLALYLMVL